jgi:hypothetical protein
MSFCNIRLATSQANLAKGYIIYNWRIPEPSLPQYPLQSQTVDLSSGGQARRGFSQVSILWNRLLQTQARTLFKLVADVGNGQLFATIDKAWSGGSGLDGWIDVSGYPSVQVLSPVPNSQAGVFDNVVLTLTNITIINDPASV